MGFKLKSKKITLKNSKNFTVVAPKIDKNVFKIKKQNSENLITAVKIWTNDTVLENRPGPSSQSFIEAMEADTRGQFIEVANKKKSLKYHPTTPELQSRTLVLPDLTLNSKENLIASQNLHQEQANLELKAKTDKAKLIAERIARQHHLLVLGAMLF